MQKFLAFSTIQRGILIILQEDSRIIYTQTVETDKQSELLVSSLNGVLKKNNLDYFDIDAFATIVGPGNFTSIKTSIAVLKALKIATGKKAITTNMFEIIGFEYLNKTLDTSLRWYDSILSSPQIVIPAEAGIQIPIILKQNENKYYIKDGDNYSMVSNLDGYNNAIVSDGTFSKETWAKINYEKFLRGEFSETVEPLYIEPPKVTCRKK